MTKHTQEQEVEDTEVPKTSKAKRLNRKHKITIATIVIVILIIIAGGVSWLYTGKLSSSKEKIFRKLPLPVALVNSKHITSKQLFERVDLAKKVLASSGQPTADIEIQLLDQLIETKKIDVIAAQHNVQTTDQDIENSYKAILRKFPNSDENEFSKTLLENYGMDLSTFKKEVVSQTVLQDNLKLWFNQQESLNNDQYSKARDLVSQLDSGTPFDEVAKKYSQDTSSKDFAGDSGFVKYSDMLPEFQAAVKDLSIGNIKIVASRFGIHVLRVNAIEGDSNNQDERTYNLQQIFIEPADFIEWIKIQSAQIRTVKLL